jgi:hypothetical protein
VSIPYFLPIAYRFSHAFLYSMSKRMAMMSGVPNGTEQVRRASVSQ